MKIAQTALTLVLFTGLALAWVTLPATLTRGPYLQSVHETGTTLVLGTDVDTDVTLRVGREVGGSWEREETSAVGRTHEFELEDLQPDTRYYYTLESGGSTLAEGEEYFFSTAPPENSRRPFRFTAWGDSGTGNASQADVAAELEAVHPQPEFAIGLGDLVYPNGQPENYDPRFFDPYEELLRNTPIWATIGNHDVETQAGAPYFDAFYLPTDTGAEANPSGTESYYSFDYGMAHFVCVDSQVSDNSVGGTMYRWVEDDLDDALARGKRWLVVFMHHPPYTKGTHNSDTEGSLINLRQNLVPLFESKGVDMVLSGHSHVYERSFLAKDDAVLQADPSEYTKIGSPDGTIYMVSGCGGQSGSGPLNHPLMATSIGNTAGANVFDVSFDEIHGYFLDEDGNKIDLFTVRKEVDDEAPRLVDAQTTAADELTLVYDEPVLGGTASFGAEAVGNYSIDPPISVLGATLDDDLRTVVLDVSVMQVDVAYEVTVLRNEDPSGNQGSATVYAVYEGTGVGSETTVMSIPRGAVWRYFEGSTFPGGSWMNTGFDDSAWGTGAAGFGYGDGDDATLLADMENGYATVYARRTFDVTNANAVTGLDLAVSYDDGFVAYLNGVEVARSNVPAGQTNTTLAAGQHEAGTFEVFDLSASLGELVDGQNLLAIEGHNAFVNSSDFSLHPEVMLTLPASSAPIAILEVGQPVSNAPATVEFRAGDSVDPDGLITGGKFDFGDGSPMASGGVNAEHVYTQAGTYTATLILTDDSGLQSIATRTVRIHDQGASPTSSFTMSESNPDAGVVVDFDGSASSDPDGGSVYFSWDFDDEASGTSNYSSEAQPSHAFATNGAYEVALTIVDDEGSIEVDRTYVLVGDGIPPPDPPVAEEEEEEEEPAADDDDDGGGGGGGGGCYTVPTSGPSRGDPSLILALASVFVFLGIHSRRLRDRGTPVGA